MADDIKKADWDAGVPVRAKDRGTSRANIVGIDLNPAGSPEQLMAGSMPVTGSFPDSSTIQTLVGATNESAPVADSGTPSGVNGRLQRIAQRLTSLIALLPTALGGSGGLKVEVISGSAGNAAAGNTGSAVPAQADYSGLNVAGTMRGRTGANPSGTVYAAQTDVTSIGGTLVDTNSGNKSAGTQRVVLATDQPQLTNPLKVDGTGGTFPISGTTTVQQGTAASLQSAVQGNTAAAGADSGNPVKVGAVAVAMGANPSAFAAGDRTNNYATRHGQLFTIGGHPNVQTLRLNITATQTNTAVIVQNAGGKIVVTRVRVAADNANTDNVAVRIGFGTASAPTTTGVVYSHPGLAAALVDREGDGSGILGVGADDEDLRVTTGAVVGTYSVDIVVSYFVLPS